MLYGIDLQIKFDFERIMNILKLPILITYKL